MKKQASRAELDRAFKAIVASAKWVADQWKECPDARPTITKLMQSYHGSIAACFTSENLQGLERYIRLYRRDVLHVAATWAPKTER